jgi:hypothetical protein
MSSDRVLFVGYVANQQMPGLRPLNHPPSLPRQMLRKPIRNAKGESPANGQYKVIKRTLNLRKHLQRHNISLPLVLFGKGDKGQGLDGDWELIGIMKIIKKSTITKRRQPDSI